MNEKTKRDLSVETSERFSDFCESLKELVSETQNGMTDVGRMSRQVELESEIASKVEHTGTRVNNLEGNVERISYFFSEIKETVDAVNSLKIKCRYSRQE